ncbi:MAG TPA: hypothetical protein VK897_26890 [Anaerolineales bacterium]|nr:hypothetical protein [Anaerolineales bacterium]
MSTKRVILANNSRLLREMLHNVINRADNLEVVQEIPDQKALPSAIERFDPEWVIVSASRGDAANHWLNSCLSRYPSVRYIVLSPDHSSIRIRSQASYEEEDLSRLSIDDFIHVLERDLQHT